MQNHPPPSANHIQIADDAVTRITSTASGGAYAHHQLPEKSGLTKWDTQEKGVEEEEEAGDERDVRKKQVRLHDPTGNQCR